MHRRALALLAALLMFSCAARAEVSAWPGQSIGRMVVVNCEEWVSLRAAPYTSSDTLAEVPLGDVVVNCRRHSDVFTHCRTYGGQDGYILNDYLEAPEFRLLTAMDAREGTKVFDEVADYRGDWELDIVQLGLRVLCQRSYDGVHGGETLRASCFDASDRFLWGLYTEALSVTELNLTDAWIGGAWERPLLMVNNVDLGLAAIDPATGTVAWTLDSATLNLGASQAHANDEDGTLYVGGYYGPDPVAISINGEVLWQSDAGEDAVWLVNIRVEDNEIVAEYDAPDDDGLGEVRYNRATGWVRSSEPIGG